MLRRAAGRRAGLVALVAAAAILAGCTSAPAGGHAPTASGLTARQVRAIVTRTAAVNNRANAHLDTGLLRSYETQSAFTIDSAVYTMERKAHASPASAGLSAFGVKVLSMAVPRLAGYPYAFAVIGSTYSIPSGKALPGSPCASMRTLLVYEQASAGAGWKITLEPDVDDSSLGSFAGATGGRAPGVPAPAAAASLALPGRVARALEQYETSGNLGPFSKADFDGKCWNLPDPRSDLKDAESAGLSAREVISPSGPAASYLLAGNRMLVLFTLSTTEELLPPGANRSIGWKAVPKQDLPSVLLPTGKYSEIVEHSVVEVAIVVPLRPGGRPATRFTVVGDYSGIVGVTGTHSSAPVGPSGTSGPGTSGPSGNSGTLVSFGR